MIQTATCLQFCRISQCFLYLDNVFQNFVVMEFFQAVELMYWMEKKTLVITMNMEGIVRLILQTAVEDSPLNSII